MNSARQAPIVIPAIIPQNVTHLAEALRTVAFAHEVHIDVVDGQFVSSVSWPYDPPGQPIAQQSMLAHHTVEVDLMVADPLPAAAAWVAAGAQMVVFHVETITPKAFADFAATYDAVTVGVSALNDTSWDTVVPYLEVADYVQVMGIAAIGAQGAAFDVRVLERIALLANQYPSMAVSVDGSVNTETIPRLVEAGANRFVAGSAIMHAADPQAAYQELHTLARPQQ